MDYILAILIFTGGNYRSGTAVSQMNIEFKSEEACKKAEAYYNRPDVLKYYQDYAKSTSDQQGRDSRRVTVDAKCWPKE